MLKFLLTITSMALPASADLRMASQPKHEWNTQQRNNKVPFQSKYALYMEPSDFNYEGLKKQRDGGGYDNFLRSNIDNEQDRRNFNTEPGEDHLPFRSFETGATDASTTVLRKMVPLAKEEVGVTGAGDYILALAGVPHVVPLRWNNPHSAELEVNIWIMNKGAAGPFVIPIKKPTCSGEGYQDNVFTFTVPADFNTVASCMKVGECILQVYAHSVESRMYSMGTPIVVEGGTGLWTPGAIKEAQIDHKFNLQDLRRLCLPSSDPNDEADHKNAVVHKARLSSDQYNHAYQNSDFSPYAGQQPDYISQNLQASCILKMSVGNFGELGKEYMAKTANEARQYADQLDKKAKNLIRSYETTTNAIIYAIKEDVQNTDTLKFIDLMPQGATRCEKWVDQYDRKAEGRERGLDRTGGWCLAGSTCLCHGDCYLGSGQGDKDPDAYCGKLEAKSAEAKDAGLRKIVTGSETARLGADNTPQKTEECFRCAEVGSIKTQRQNTNTYIPSFEIHGAVAVEKARENVAPVMLKSGFLTHPDTGAITQKGDTKAILQIYIAVLSDMWAEFKMASDGSYLKKFYLNKYNQLKGSLDAPKAEDLQKFMFTYRGPVMKLTTTTLSDANGGVDRKFMKLDGAGNEDKGYYSAAKAWPLQARGTGSSTAVPQSAGPLNNVVIPSTTNHNDGAKSGGTKYTIPPAASAEVSCSYVAAGASSDGVVITEENKDMDGLNGDADCDDDDAIQVVNTAHDAACLVESDKDITYVCPPYPAPVCTIPGQGGIQPGQMFTNDDGSYDATATSAASLVLPTASAFLVAIFAFAL